MARASRHLEWLLERVNTQSSSPRPLRVFLIITTKLPFTGAITRRRCRGKTRRVVNTESEKEEEEFTRIPVKGHRVVSTRVAVEGPRVGSRERRGASFVLEKAIESPGVENVNRRGGCVYTNSVSALQPRLRSKRGRRAASTSEHLPRGIKPRDNAVRRTSDEISDDYSNSR